MRILVEHPHAVDYHPSLFNRGDTLTAIYAARTLCNMGHSATLAAVQGAVKYPNVLHLDRQYRQPQLYAASLAADVVIWNSVIESWILQYPDLVKKLLVVDNYNGANDLQTIARLKDGGAIFVTTNTAVQHHHGRLDNQVVPTDRAPLVEYDPKMLIAVGANRSTKRLNLAARAMDQLRAYGYHGIIFTDRPGVAYDNVRIGAPHSEIMKAMAQSLCLLQPTAIEMNGGRVTFEAASHGLPVIHAITNADYFLVPSGTSIRVEDPIVENMVQAVLQLAPHDRLQVRQWFDTHYSEQQFAQRLLDWIAVVTDR